MDIRKKQRVVVEALEDIKGRDILVYNTARMPSMFERVVIASGDSTRQVKALADSVLALIAMLPLAITSTAGWVRRLTFKRWKRLHRLIYLTAIAAVIHYWWLVKSDIRLPLMYAAIVTVLLGYRLIVWMRERKRKSAAPTSQPTVSTS